MSVSLSQSSLASFPDRGAVGLLVTCEAGTDGGCLTCDVPDGATASNLRVMIAPQSLTGGRIVFARALDDAGDEVFRLTLDADGPEITVGLATDQQLTAALHEGLRWHCVELGMDAQADTAALWINGMLADQVSGDMTALAPRAVELGGVFKDSTTLGAMHLDEWVIADGYIGPQIIEPTREHADDPARWLVIYNTAVADSVIWAQAYGEARRVPLANLLGLELSTDETIDEAAFDALRSAMEDYLDRHGLADHVMGILCGYGVPGNFTVAGGSVVESIPVQIQAPGGSYVLILNPLANADPPDRPTAANLGAYRLSARMDGPTLAEALAMTSRASDIEQQGLGEGDQAVFHFDPVTLGSFAEPQMQRMGEWAASVERQRLRLPFQQTTPTDPPAEVSFDSIDHDGVFWGWRQDAPPEGFFGEPAGRRVLCAQIAEYPATLTTLRDPDGDDWPSTALRAGYAAAAGSPWPISIGGVPDVQRCFAALRDGWTLAEAWFVASPYLREALTLIGDPLLTVPFPRAGTNIYGPFASWAEANDAACIAALRPGERHWTLPAEHRPAEGQMAIYVLRRVDAAGREERGFAHVIVQTVNGKPVNPPPAPLLRSAREQDDAWWLTWAWGRRLGACAIAAVQLIAQRQGESGQTVAQQTPDPQAASVRFAHEPTGEPVRYRLRVIGLAGGTVVSAWSDWLTRSDRPVHPLQLIAQTTSEAS